MLKDSEFRLVRLSQRTYIKAYGTKELLVEIAQQIAWLAATFRDAQDQDLSLSEVMFLSSKKGSFGIRNLPLSKVEGQDRACWTTLFPGTAIAHEYPTPVRGRETGIEIPFHLMTSLSGSLYPMSLDGGIYFKGYSRLLFPTAVSEDGSIQWHLICNRGTKNPIAMNAIHHQKWIKISSPLKLAKARTFLGYCREVVVDMGTDKSTHHYRNILFSGLHDEQYAPAVGMPSTLTAGTGGLPFNVGMTIPITRTKSLLNPMNDTQDYMDVLEDSKTRPVIIYDTDEESARGWMVPAISVILHMVHSWSAKYAHDSFSEGFPHVDLVTKTGDAARDILLSRWDFVLRKTIDENLHKDKLVKDLVMQYWDAMVQRRFHDLEAMSQAPPQAELAYRKLYGWEYMDVVVGKHSRRQQVGFEANWGHFLEDCIVLFGKRFGNLIQPAADVPLCYKRDPIPTKKAFLTATISCLETLAYERGGSRDQLTSPRLTNKGYWHYQPKELFADCHDCDTKRCRKVPQYLHSSVQKENSGLIPPSEGAVVFGKDVKKLQKPATKRKRSTKTFHAENGGFGWRSKLLTRFRVKRDVDTAVSSLRVHEQSDVASSDEGDDLD